MQALRPYFVCSRVRTPCSRFANPPCDPLSMSMRTSLKWQPLVPIIPIKVRVGSYPNLALIDLSAWFPGSSTSRGTSQHLRCTALRSMWPGIGWRFMAPMNPAPQRHLGALCSLAGLHGCTLTVNLAASRQAAAETAMKAYVQNREKVCLMAASDAVVGLVHRADSLPAPADAWILWRGGV